GIHPDAVVAQGVPGAHPARDRADRHEVPGGADDVPESAPGAVDALEEPHAARPHVRPDGRPTELADDALEPLGDLVEGRLPGDPLEVVGALRTDAPHRVEEPLGRLRVRDVVVELVAQDAAREGVIRIAFEPHGPAIAHGDHPATGVRAVHRAGAGNLAVPPRVDAHVSTIWVWIVIHLPISLRYHAASGGA